MNLDGQFLNQYQDKHVDMSGLLDRAEQGLKDYLDTCDVYLNGNDDQHEWTLDGYFNIREMAEAVLKSIEGSE